MTTVNPTRPWYCLDPLVDDWRTVYQHGGDLYVLRLLKIARSIIVNIGIIAITMYGLIETNAAPTWIAMLGISTLALYNGVEVADYAALAQALISYFGGEDLTGKIKSANADAYAAFISVLTDSSISGFEKRRNLGRDVLREELRDAFKEAGFVGPTGELTIPGRNNYSEIPSSSIGPLLPAIVAILEVEYGIDSTEAVRQYRSESIDVILPSTEEDSGAEIDAQQEQDWKANIRNTPGFQPDAEAYVYVLELERLSDSATWFYVGKREGRFLDLVGYIRTHARKFTRSRVVAYHRQEILLGDYNSSMAPQGTTHRVVGIERIVPISADELESLDSSDAPSCYISEIERRTSYEVSLDHETTNVLGGK